MSFILSTLASTSPASPLHILLYVLFAFILSVGIYAFGQWNRFRGYPLPPGPPGHWLFGTAIPSTQCQRAFLKWTQEYGPIFSVRSGSQLLVIIGGHQTAVDILEKHNSALVDRPRNISAGEVLSGDKRTLLVGQGERLKKLRKAVQSQMNITIVEKYEHIQMQNAKNVILDILVRPERHQDHTKRYAASTIISIAYGKTTPSDYSDPVVQEINKCLIRISAAARPGAYLVDSFPILRFVPGYLSELRKWHQEELALFKGELEKVRLQVARGEAQPSFSKYLIEHQDELQMSDDELAYLAGSMFGAGSDTTAAAISVCIMAAACYPETQKKVQDQLDLVVGRDKVPSFSDMSELTEVTAFVLESYRWRPISVGGFAHRATRDIPYGQYVIPAGASVIGNHWALGRDASVYPDPEAFKPQRWLDTLGNIREGMKFANFGFGRRVCPGQHIANRSVSINAALIMWAFDISQDPIAPIDTLAFTNTANTHPLPFKVKFEPRIPNVRELLVGGA